MTSYIETMNALLAKHAAASPGAILYGENIDNGSRISGLTKKLVAPPGGRIINVGDNEYAHIGLGFGIMMNGGIAALFAKQLDFMLLGMDHMVNTYNSIRAFPPERLGSFTIACIVCDQGMQGPQSSLNAIGDVASMARFPAYTLTNRDEAELVLDDLFSRPGFRIVALSQRLFGTDVLAPGIVAHNDDASVIQHHRGDDATLVAFNFAYPQVENLRTGFLSKGRTASLFKVNHVPDPDWALILADVRRTGRLLILDDSKSVNSQAYEIAYVAQASIPGAKVEVVRRDQASVPFGVDPEVFEPTWHEAPATGHS